MTLPSNNNHPVVSPVMTRRKQAVRMGIMLLLFLAMPAIVSAETVTLKSGKVIEGKVIEKTDTYIKIDTGAKVWKILFRMMKDDDAARLAPPGKGTRPQGPVLRQVVKPGLPGPSSASQDIFAVLREKIAPRDYRYAMTGFGPEDYRQAIEKLQKTPNPPVSVRLSIAKAYFYMGDMDRAINELQRVLTDKPDSGDAMFSLGFVYWTTGDVENTLKYYKQAVSVAPEYAYGQIGDIYRGQGRCEEALKFYKDYLRVYPEDYPGKFGVYDSMGRCAATLKKFDEAVEYFSKSVEYNPDDAAAYLDLGFAYRLKKDYKNALNAFRKAVELEPGNYYAQKGLGDTYRSLQQPQESIEPYRKAVDLRPNAALIFQIVKGLSAQGKYKECLDYLERAETLSPKDPTIYQSKGRYLLYLERFDEAKINYRKAVDLYKQRKEFDKVVTLQQTIRAVDRLQRKEGE